MNESLLSDSVTLETKEKRTKFKIIIIILVISK